jgi:hypothetical protein
VKRLKRETYLQTACGYTGKIPTEAHFSQMKKRIGILFKTKKGERFFVVVAMAFF